MPDHSLLSVSIDTCRHTCIIDPCDELKSDKLKGPSRFYNYNSIPEDFLSNAKWRNIIVDIIDKLQFNHLSQDSLDDIYGKFASHIFEQMDEYLEYRDASKQGRKRLKHSKPYWNDELFHLWKDMHTKERALLRCKGGQNIRNMLRHEFYLARSIFDKKFRFFERKYKHDKLIEINDSGM
jgi:hypothetical protein